MGFWLYAFFVYGWRGGFREDLKEIEVIEVIEVVMLCLAVVGLEIGVSCEMRDTRKLVLR